jgi:hypothetical protein
MKKKKKTWVKFRHRLVQGLLRYPGKLFFFLLYRLRTQTFTGWHDGRPCFILGNHTTPLDPVCLGTSFRFPIYYVASDHVLRQGMAGKLLRFLVEPIPIMKSRIDLKTIKDMLTVVSEGGSISLFPEGNRNFNGETAGFQPAVAKLARQLNIPLVLYRFEGGYFTAPRWAVSIRCGKMTGCVVRVVSVEAMKAMTSTELYEIIKAELHVDAYAVQRKDPVRYRGRRLAESLERVLYLCPGCLGMATLKSTDDIVSCGCGLKARYTQYGLLEQAGEMGLPFNTILEWDHWQKDTLQGWLSAHLSGTGSQEPLASDNGQSLYACVRAGSNTLLGEGRFSLYPDRFLFEGIGETREFPLEGISKVVIQGKQALQFTDCEGATYEVKSPFARSALKYLNLFELLKSKDSEVQHGLFSL